MLDYGSRDAEDEKQYESRPQHGNQCFQEFHPAALLNIAIEQEPERAQIHRFNAVQGQQVQDDRDQRQRQNPQESRVQETHKPGSLLKEVNRRDTRAGSGD